jgi:high-affinity iron transporter
VVVLATFVVVTASVVLTSAASPLVKSSPLGIVVTSARCAPGWAPRQAGRLAARIDDRSGRAGTIYLFNPYSGVTVAHATLRPGTATALTVDLKAGRYAWSCRLGGLAATRSRTVTVRPRFVRGGADGPAVAIPVTAHQMAGAVASYRAYVTGQLALLSGQVQLLQAAVTGGQLAGAEAAWLTAHLTWHRIGGAYDAFGALGTDIDGTAGGLGDGIESPQFTGFHKVELDLWQNHDLAAAAADASVLAGFTRRLVAQFPDDTILPAELPLRAHEILEDALRDELSGDDDYGSGTDMASVEADVDGTRELLGLLSPLLSARAPDLVARATTQLDRLDTALAATESGGRWVAVAQVPLAQREQVDGAIGAALEILAPLPDLLPVQGSTL